MTPRRIALCIAFLLATSALAQQPNFRFIPGPKSGGGEVSWSVGEHGSVEAQQDEYLILEHEVVIEYQDIKVRADKITYNLKTRDVVAEGHVVIDQGPTRLGATQAVFNLETKTGTFFNANATLDPGMYFSGERIEKVGEDTYRLTNGIFTSCDLDKPAWSFHVGEAEIKLDDYARMNNLSFRAGGVPIFWTPRLIWPTKSDRSQGFLIPRARFHNRFGTRLETAYFLPYEEWADATIHADVSTKQYLGVGADVRYLPSENVEIGDLRAYAVNNAEANEFEWKYHYRHAQEGLPGGFRGVVDMQDYSNLDFFREYDHDPRLHTLSNIYSSAYLTKNRPNYSLNILSDRRDIVFGNARQRYEQLPSLQLRVFPQRVGSTPFYFSIESSTSRLRSGGLIAGERTVDADYLRTDIFPTVSMRLRTPQWLSVKPQISLRETWYSSSRDDQGRIQDDPVSRFYAQGHLEVVGPSFSRIFNRPVSNFSRFKHVIEPRIRYTYTTDVEDQHRILRFDTVDSPFLPIVRDSVEYSLTQRLIGKEKGEEGNAREVLSFALRQSVALSDPFPSAGSSFFGEHQFTPLVASLRFNPYQSTTFDARATFGNVSRRLDQISVSANLVGTAERADRYLGFTYFETRPLPGFPSSGSNQVRINSGSSLVRDRLRADVQLNFDARNRRFLEQRYLTGWTGSCYGVALEYRRYLVFGQASLTDWSYGVAVTLKNVGTIGN
jgi:LPS-assembly protein